MWTLAITSGTYCLSLVTGTDAPLFEEALDRFPLSSDLVINLDGLGRDELREAVNVLRRSWRLGRSAGLVIVVAGDAEARALLELSGVDQAVLVEQTFDDAFRYVFRRAWLTGLAATGSVSGRAR